MNSIQHDAGSTDWFERAAIGASALCLIHCAGLPLLLAALPALSNVLALPEKVHVWVLGFAIPTTSVALVFGYKQHMARSPLIVGCLGLLLLSVGALALLGSPLEMPVTVVGSLFLVSAHLQNWRLRHHRHWHE